MPCYARCERIAYNALPGTIDPQMWSHQYLQQANEINARYNITDHVWQTDGADSTGFGVAPNFGCCTANLQQGWPKLVSNTVMEKPPATADAPPTLVLALLAPVEATLRGAHLRVVTDYPFGDNATVFVTGSATLQLRIPAWATRATVAVNGGAAAAAANGTMFEVDATAGPSTVVQLELNPAVVVETGWGLRAANASSPVDYAAGGAPVPTALEDDWELGGIASDASLRARATTAQLRSATEEPEPNGAGWTPSKDKSFTADLRSGNPGEVNTAVVGHPVWGAASPAAKLAHGIARVQLSFRYVAGYTGSPDKKGSTVAVVLLDAANKSDVATLWTSLPLTNYSFDRFSGYSPPVHVDADGLSVPNGRALLVALRFTNNERNLQLPLDPAGGFGVQITWAAQATDVAVRPPKLGAATNAAAVLRGPLLYSLYLEETCTGVVKTWSPFNNTDIDLTTTDKWNFAISRDEADLRFERLGAPGALPFNVSHFPSVIHARAKPVPDWTSHHSAADEPPPSPVDASQLGDQTDVLLVPYGASNLRMSGLPWY